MNDISKRKRGSGSTLPQKLNLPSSDTISDPADIASNLNKHFVEKGPKLAAKLPNISKDPLSNMGPRINTDLCFEHISTVEVMNLIHSFENKKSTGSDEIPSLLLKNKAIATVGKKGEYCCDYIILWELIPAVYLTTESGGEITSHVH